MLKVRRGVVLSTVAIAGSLAILASFVGPAVGSTPRQVRMDRWRQAIERLQVPGAGCFTASYPRIEWLRTACQAAPPHPYPPARGYRPLTVGNGLDYSAEVSGVLTGASGSFDFVSNGTSETGEQNGSGPQVPNTFSLQLNAKPFTSPECSGSPNPGCLGWQQFVYSTTYNEIFMQYWLLLYNTTCPAGWMQFQFTGSSDIYCYANSPSSDLPGGPLTVAGLTGTTLTGKTSKGGNDSVIMTSASGDASAVNADSVLDIADHWKGVEFAIVGDCCGKRANFSAGTTIKVKTTVQSGTKLAPTCVVEGFTGETNNLNLASAPTIGTASSPDIVSKQTSSPGFAACGAAAAVGDTHLTTFRDLFYDFQASGDYELATTGPQFTVEDRQVSDAPHWPNAAVSRAVATRVGTSDVAVCLASSAGKPSPRLVVNEKTVKLSKGETIGLPGGGDVSLAGSTYTITDVSGDSVRAAVNAGKPNWLNVSVGVARWPETVHGLLANAGSNPKTVESRAGTVLTAPFHFTRFYHAYGNSWRVSAGQSLLSACGGQVTSSDPKNLMYAGNLKPKVADAARSTCLRSGVPATSPALLNACTVDVAILGTKKAAQAYLGGPSVIWGKITKP
jgi:hypothetical protein